MNSDINPITKVSNKSNVHIKLKDSRNGKILKTYNINNMILKKPLYGLCEFMRGAFEATNSSLRLSDYYFQYLSVGNNTSPTNINSISLGNEVDITNPVYNRVPITQKVIYDNSDNNFITLSLRVYVPTTWYVGYTINEIGLFSGSSGQNLLARVVLPEPIQKTNYLIIDVAWEITFTSIIESNAVSNQLSLTTSSTSSPYIYHGFMIYNNQSYLPSKSSISIEVITSRVTTNGINNDTYYYIIDDNNQNTEGNLLSSGSSYVQGSGSVNYNTGEYTFELSSLPVVNPIMTYLGTLNS